MLTTTILLAATLSWAATTDDVFQAVRNNDITRLRELLTSNTAANSRDTRGVPVIMHAAAFGSVEALEAIIAAGGDVNAANGLGATALIWGMSDKGKARMLIAAGANVNVKTKMEKTPLLVASAHEGYADILRLLLDKGADIKAVDVRGSSALHNAAGVGDVEMVRLLLERGADANATDKGAGTPLQGAAIAANSEVSKLLLAKGASAKIGTNYGGEVKKGPIALKNLTALHFAAPYGPLDLVQALLDAGTDVNAKDVRGMTPLMLAIASDFADPAIVRLLLAKGADVNVKSLSGETALDWAGKFKVPAIMELLRKAGAQPGDRQTVPTIAAANALDSRAAVEKSIPLLMRASIQFFKETGCVGCHHQPVTMVALKAARNKGIVVDAKAEDEIGKTISLSLPQLSEIMLQRMDPPAGPDILNYSALALIAMGQGPSNQTDAMINYLAAIQSLDGAWHFGGIARPPVEDGDLPRTAFAVQALRVFSPPGRKAAIDARIAKARGWMKSQKPLQTEARVMQLLGLFWAGASPQELTPLANAVRKLQRPDGGWAQTVHLESDAYSTGLTLWALDHAHFEKPVSKAYQQGVRYLLRAQKADGSWYVRSRSPKFQPYFESGFPYGDDQWISSTATAWATAALSNTIPFESTQK